MLNLIPTIEKKYHLTYFHKHQTAHFYKYEENEDLQGKVH